MSELLQGFRGKPSHLPVIDAHIGAYAVAAIANALPLGRAGPDDDVLPEPGAHDPAPISAPDPRGRRPEQP